MQKSAKSMRLSILQNEQSLYNLAHFDYLYITYPT